MKKAIVTGANGFVGSALTAELSANYIEVIALDLEGNFNNIPQNEMVRFVPYDLKDMKRLPETVNDTDIDVFYHLAWAGSSGEARADTALQLCNAQWTVDSLRVSKELGCERFVCAGSIMEHEAMLAAYSNGNRPGLGYIYGSGKLVAHTMCFSVAANIGSDLIWTNITNSYGPGEVSPRLINSSIRKIIDKKPLQFTTGTQNYDFVYITDVARAFRLIGEKGRPFHEYLIGSGEAKPLREFILEMKDSIGQDAQFIFGDVPFTGVNIPLELFDCSLTEEHTGFRAGIPFSEGVKHTMEWIKSNL